MDAWATITLLVSAGILSVFRFRGADFDALMTDWSAMPQEPWRLASSTLLHGSWLHLVFNLFWTFRFGVILEAMFGTVWWTLILLVLAVGSMAAEWAFVGSAIGLSGIGYGAFGLLWSLDRWHPRCRGVLDRRVAELFALWFLFCLVATYYRVMPVANVAHGAGALLGGLLGWTLAAPFSRRRTRALVTLATLTLTLALALAPPLRDVVNRSDAYAYELFQESLAAIEAKDWPRAAKQLEGAAARTNWREAWHNLAIVYRAQGRFEEALEASQRARSAEADSE
jgi:membrane associated rhomboid family serine protease